MTTLAGRITLAVATLVGRVGLAYLDWRWPLPEQGRKR